MEDNTNGIRHFAGRNIRDPKYSNGILYAGFGPLKMGWDSEGVRHFFQNRLVHDQFFKVGHGQLYPHILRTNRRDKFYFQFGDGGNTLY